MISTLTPLPPHPTPPESTNLDQRPERNDTFFIDRKEKKKKGRRERKEEERRKERKERRQKSNVNVFLG